MHEHYEHYVCSFEYTMYVYAHFYGMYAYAVSSVSVGTIQTYEL